LVAREPRCGRAAGAVFAAGRRALAATLVERPEDGRRAEEPADFEVDLLVGRGVPRVTTQPLS
ncbi:MAG TPA: hypothetical protein VN108_10105, partial [Marmoricola sp.]|nr:hypothetical protein [Marmoricola sp.]